MHLYLVQHADTKPEAEDPQRALSDKGLAEIEKTAKLLAAKIRPSLKVIMHSGKLRAQQTAGVLADHISPVGGIRPVDGLKPNDNVAVWADYLADLSEDVMLVGHLPHLSKLAAKLLCGDETKSPVQFRNAGIVCLVRDDEERWCLEWFIVPGLCD